MRQGRKYMEQKGKDLDEGPKILGACDLVHLNRGQRIAMVGKDKWISRRDFLKELLGAAAVISLPLIAATSCKPPGTSGSSGSGETGDSGCTCETNVLGTAPTVTGTYPEDGDESSWISFVKIGFSQPMNKSSVEAGISVDPAITGLCPSDGVWWSVDGTEYEFQVGTGITEGTIYTFSVDGSAKAENGYYLNETEAGEGGTSYFFSVYNPISSCGVDCGCESYQVCSCQFDGGTGCPTYGGICWCEVQCGCQLYGI